MQEQEEKDLEDLEEALKNMEKNYSMPYFAKQIESADQLKQSGKIDSHQKEQDSFELPPERFTSSRRHSSNNGVEIKF